MGWKWFYMFPGIMAGLVMFILSSQNKLEYWSHQQERQQVTAKAEFANIDTDLSAVICVVQKEEGDYLDEWVDYHLALGFSDIYIYDNINNSQPMIDWQQQERQGDERIHIIPHPGDKVQVPVYKKCAHLVKELNHTWVTFMDVDEFLVLKKHDNVIDFALEHVSEGHLGINWEIYGTSGRKTHEKQPVTQRFECIHYSIRNKFVKSLIKVTDLGRLDQIRSPHAFPLREGAKRVDTDGMQIMMSRHEGPRDVAVINHYYYRSNEEYINKRKRGDVFYGDKGAAPNLTAMAEAGLDLDGTPLPAGYRKDETAWQILKKLVPSYEKYEKDKLKEQPECTDEASAEISIKTEETAAICVVHKDETWYLNEWAHYHLALGFSDIYLYDNSEDSWHLMEWKKRQKSPQVHFIDWYGEGVQMSAYRKCALRAQERNHTWVMFLDIDEFLDLKKHKDVVEFARATAQKGAVAINSQMFGTAGREKYEPSPTTYRFQCLIPDDERNAYVKSLVRLDDLGSIDDFSNPHLFPMRKGISTVDTSGKAVTSEKHAGPFCVAVINHYYYRSKEEFAEKLGKGDVLTGEKASSSLIQSVNEGDDPFTGESLPTGTFRDDSIWQKMKQIDPKYKKYDKDTSADRSICSFGPGYGVETG